MIQGVVGTYQHHKLLKLHRALYATYDTASQCWNRESAYEVPKGCPVALKNTFKVLVVEGVVLSI